MSNLHKFISIYGDIEGKLLNNVFKGDLLKAKAFGTFYIFPKTVESIVKHRMESNDKKYDIADDEHLKVIDDNIKENIGYKIKIGAQGNSMIYLLHGLSLNDMPYYIFYKDLVANLRENFSDEVVAEFINKCEA